MKYEQAILEKEKRFPNGYLEIYPGEIYKVLIVPALNTDLWKCNFSNLFTDNTAKLMSCNNDYQLLGVCQSDIYKKPLTMRILSK